MKTILSVLVLFLIPMVSLSQEWEDWTEYTLRYSKLEAHNVQHTIDTLNVPEHWKEWNRAFVIIHALEGAVPDNPKVADHLKKAIEMHPHPLFVLWYCIADFRKSTTEKWIDYLWEEDPEYAKDLEEYWQEIDAVDAAW